MSITSIIGKLFLPRQKELERHINEAGALQNEVLAYLTAVPRTPNTAESTYSAI